MTELEARTVAESEDLAGVLSDEALDRTEGAFLHATFVCAACCWH